MNRSPVRALESRPDRCRNLQNRTTGFSGITRQTVDCANWIPFNILRTFLGYEQRLSDDEA
jgi:hypothetical protein